MNFERKLPMNPAILLLELSLSLSICLTFSTSPCDGRSLKAQPLRPEVNSRSSAEQIRFCDMWSAYHCKSLWKQIKVGNNWLLKELMCPMQHISLCRKIQANASCHTYTHNLYSQLTPGMHNLNVIMIISQRPVALAVCQAHKDSHDATVWISFRKCALRVKLDL